MSQFVRNLLHFERLLHAMGVPVQAGRMPELVTALGLVDVGRRFDVYVTLRAFLVSRQQDLDAFDAAFRVFWRDWRGDSPRGPAISRPYGAPRIEGVAATRARADGAAPREIDRQMTRTDPASASARERLGAVDFAELTEAELQEARAIIERMSWSLGERRTRRWRPGRGSRPDLARAIRRSLRLGGELVAIPKRARQVKPRPLVLVCDVSGSMERYSRMLIQFAVSVSGGARRVEVFLFSTRLTRVTPALTPHRGRRRLDVAERVPDWGGGTRIGEALRAFNLRWARRVLVNGPVVLIISDGWDRGEPGVLAQEIARLQRSCHRLVWLNPLLGSPDYRPLTRGMQAALPFVDDFMPIHNLDSLESLARHLERLAPV